MRKAAAALMLWIIANGMVIGTSVLFRQSVASAWKKGPLIDPASPYAPENAALLFGGMAVVFLHLYVLTIWKLRPRKWAPLLGILVGLVGSEVGVRLYLARDMVTYFRPHPTLQWVVRPNLHDFDNLKGGGKISTNADGMREVVADYEKAPGEYRVLVLGDSSNFGHGVEGNETWSSQLQRLVPRLTVLNGACPGWTTTEGRLFLEEVGLRYHPDLVIAGFNNDPTPEYMTDSERVPGPALRLLNGLLFRSEAYLLVREVALSLVRRAAGHADERKAGTEPLYGALSEKEQGELTARVPLPEFLQNLEALRTMSPDFAWINMPINRMEPEFVQRYVNPDYRAAAARWAKEKQVRLVDVDDRWLRTREPSLFQQAHVFHPNAQGHLRMAQQIAKTLFDPTLLEDGPPPAPHPETLRLGISTFTPVHAHIAAVLAEHPDMPSKYGLDLEIHTYLSGKDQGKDVAEGRLDAWFTCEIPAIHMLRDRPDARIIASVGSLGRIGLVGFGEGMATLLGGSVGVSRGSTPDMDWSDWGKGMNTQTVDLKTDDQWSALQDSKVQAIAGWDPWIADWLLRDPRLHLLAQREFRSDLAVSILWAVDQPGKAAKLVTLVTEALEIAARDREHYDQVVATVSGWSAETVRAVADQNSTLSGKEENMEIGTVDRQNLERAARFAGRTEQWSLFAPELLQGRPPSNVGTQTKTGPPNPPPHGPPHSGKSP